jgi:hypothetical protein
MNAEPEKSKEEKFREEWQKHLLKFKWGMV